MKLKRFMLGIIFFFVTLQNYAFNFSVAPTRFEIQLDKVNTNEITLINNTTNPMRLESFLESAPGYEKYSLNDYIKLYPKMVAIKPGSKQVIRFRVKPEPDMEAGEYKSYVVFKEIPLKESVNVSNEKVDAQIKMITEVGISVYGHYGEIDRGTNISNLKLAYDSQTSNLKVIADSNSKGNSSEFLKQEIEILGVGGVVTDTIDSQFGRTKRNGKSQIESITKIEGLKGKRVRVTIYNSQGKLLEKKTSDTLY